MIYDRKNQAPHLFGALAILVLAGVTPAHSQPHRTEIPTETFASHSSQDPCLGYAKDIVASLNELEYYEKEIARAKALKPFQKKYKNAGPWPLIDPDHWDNYELEHLRGNKAILARINGEQKIIEGKIEVRHQGDPRKRDFVAIVRSTDGHRYTIPVSNIDAFTYSSVRLGAIAESLEPVFVAPVKFPSHAHAFKYSADKLSENMAKVPELKQMLDAMMEDPAIPLNIKRVIKSAVEKHDTKVFELTQELRSQLRPSVQGLNSSRVSESIEFFNTGTLNDEITAALRATLDQQVSARFRVFVPNRQITAQQNDLLVLIHELAHSRFTASFEKNLPKLAERLPPSLVKKLPNGKFAVNKQFYDLLNERYAYETEYRALVATYGKYYDDWFRAFDGEGTEQQLRVGVANYVAAVYKITDPEVLKIKELPLHTLMLGR